MKHDLEAELTREPTGAGGLSALQPGVVGGPPSRGQPPGPFDAVCSTILLVGLTGWAIIVAPALTVLPLGPVMSGSVVRASMVVRAITGPLGLILVLVVEPLAVHRLLLRRRALPLMLCAVFACAAVTWLNPVLLQSAP